MTYLCISAADHSRQNLWVQAKMKRFNQQTLAHKSHFKRFNSGFMHIMLSVGSENQWIDSHILTVRHQDYVDVGRTQYFRDSIIFIHESRLKGEGCLVHWWVTHTFILHHSSLLLHTFISFHIHVVDSQVVLEFREWYFTAYSTVFTWICTKFDFFFSSSVCFNENVESLHYVMSSCFLFSFSATSQIGKHTIFVNYFHCKFHLLSSSLI